MLNLKILVLVLKKNKNLAVTYGLDQHSLLRMKFNISGVDFENKLFFFVSIYIN